MNVIKRINREQMRMDLPKFKAGDTIEVHVRIKEGDKSRIQVFKGVVLRRRRGDMDASFTVRKMSSGIGVERIFPYNSPVIEKIDVVAEGRVRRSRIYYLRDLKGKAARIKTKDQFVDKKSKKL